MESVEIVEYERKHRSEVLALMYYSRLVHTHLDWSQASYWLDYERHHTYLLYQHNQLCAVMGAGTSGNGVGWLRLVAVRKRADADWMLQALWKAIAPRLQAESVHLVSILVINSWMTKHLEALGFSFLEDVVTLQRPHGELPDPPLTDVQIRNAYLEDLGNILTIDHAAFDPAWQLSAQELRQAQRQTASHTIAVSEGQVVGYQLSTKHQSSGHLARLAVHPEIQGKRVGAALLYHLLENFEHRGVRTTTVNTQDSNVFSQRLYQRYGFFRNGYDIPIWQIHI